MNIGIGKVRTKLLDTDHKQWNCGMGVFDPNKVFYKEDPNGYVIIDGKRCKVIETPYIYEKIGDKIYKAVRMPDGKLWLTENLSTVFDGINISAETSTDPCMTVVDGNTYYNGYCVDVIDAAVADKGWHISTIDDWGELGEAAGISHYDFGTYLKTVEYNGIDKYKFGAECLGYYASGLRYNGERAYFWTSDVYEEASYDCIRLWTTDGLVDVSTRPKEIFANIRLVSNS